MASNIKRIKPGFVYILGNSELPDIIKVGEAINAEERATTLSRQTGAIGKYTVIWKHKVEDDNCAVEKAIHYKLREFSVDKEYFRIDKKRAIKIASQLVKHIKPLTNSKLKQYQSLKNKASKSKVKTASKSIWKEIINSNSKSFIRDAIRSCLKEGKVGQPQYRRFSALRSSGMTTVGRFDLYILKERLRLGVTTDSKTKSKRLIKSKIGKDVKITNWEGGVAFFISDQKQYQALKKWLQLGRHHR